MTNQNEQQATDPGCELPDILEITGSTMNGLTVGWASERKAFRRRIADLAALLQERENTIRQLMADRNKPIATDAPPAPVNGAAKPRSRTKAAALGSAASVS